MRPEEPELLARIERIKVEADEQLQEWEEEYKLDRETLALISVLAFARYRRITEDNLVLVIRGTASAFSNPLEALFEDPDLYETVRSALNGGT